MKKYKSLIFREWMIAKKLYITRFFLFLLCVGMFLFVFLFAQQQKGTALHDTSQAESLQAVSIMITYFMATLIALMIGTDNGVYKSDVNTGWLTFSWALPLTSFEKAVSKHLLTVFIIGIGSLLTTISYIVFCTMLGISFQASMLYVLFWCIDIVLLGNLIHQIIIMQITDAKKLKRISNIISIVVLVLFFTSDMFILTNEDYERLTSMAAEEMFQKIMDLMCLSHLTGFIGIILLIVILMLSFVFTWKCYERRRL